MKTILGILILLSSLSLMAQETVSQTYFCGNELESLPTQQGGRTKPLYVLANESIKHLTGKKKVQGLSAVVSYCLLNLESIGLKSGIELKTKIEHVELQKLLELKSDDPTAKYSDLVDEIQPLRIAYMKQKEENSFKKSINALMVKIQMYQAIVAGSSWTIPKVVGKQAEWIPFNSFFEKDKIEALAKDSNRPFLTALKTAETNYLEKVGDDHLLELKYAKARLPMWALLVTILALASYVVSKSLLPTLALTSTAVLLQTILLVLRVTISGRAPITNMYETVLFSGYGALILAMVVGHFQKEKIYIMVGLVYNFCTLMMLNFAHGMLSASIGPLVPVLRDNFWLSTHVTTVILSYGALALSWILANTILIKRKWSVLSSADLKRYSDLTYTCIKFGVVSLAAGIILGGVWADYSWGRFWGWDPKETWSLIVLCVYMAILHGRYTNWISTERFIPLAAASFMSVMMAWFGVNYILASGLHSYGFSEGGAIFLGSFFASQIALIAITFNVKSGGPATA